MPKKITSTCKVHGETTFFTERDGHKRCVKCRSQHVINCRRKVRKKLIEHFGGKCMVCGYSKCIAALEFHHKNPEDKEFGLSHGGNTYSFTKLLEEAKKCLLVCANCHREIEAGLINIQDFHT